MKFLSGIREGIEVTCNLSRFKATEMRGLHSVDLISNLQIFIYLFENRYFLSSWPRDLEHYKKRLFELTATQALYSNLDPPQKKIFINVFQTICSKKKILFGTK